MKLKEKLFTMRNEVGIIQKTSQSFQFKYADYTAIKGEVEPVLTKHRVLLILDTPTVTDKVVKRSEFNEYRERSQKDQFKPFTEKIELEYPVMVLKATLSDLDSEETMEFEFTYSFDASFQNFAQSTGSTYTYMRRYAYMMVFDLDLTTEDPDFIEGKRSEKQRIKEAKSEAQERTELTSKISSFIGGKVTSTKVQEIIKRISGNPKADSKNVTIEQLRQTAKEVELLTQTKESTN